MGLALEVAKDDRQTIPGGQTVQLAVQLGEMFRRDRSMMLRLFRFLELVRRA